MVAAGDRRVGPENKVIELAATALRAESAGEFRTMLDQIRAAAGLTCGQIALKSGIARSTAYALVDGNKNVVPHKPDQVRSFVMACNLSPVQVEVVMDLWQGLVDKPKTHAVVDVGLWFERMATDKAPASDSATVYGGRSVQVTGGVTGIGGSVVGGVGGDVTTGVTSGPVHQVGRDVTVQHKSWNAPRRPDSSWVSLTQYVLMSQDRTRRALKLLSALILLVAMLLGFSGYVLTQAAPKVAELFATGLGAGLVLGGTLIMVRLRRRRGDG